MLLRPVKTPGIAHVAHVIGDRGEALVVDPRRDVEVYLRIARENALTLRYVLVTHLQEDFVLGTAALQRAGARVVTGRHEQFGPRDVDLRDGESFTLGDLKLVAIETPGHTPESMSYAIYQPAVPEQAWGVLTGDALFVGTTGRTDLADPDRTAENAGVLWDSVRHRIAPLGDPTLLFPSHGSGSVCGGGFAGHDRSSIGFERAYNPVFTHDREAFARLKVSERIPRPPHFSRMAQLNREGGRVLERDPWAVVALQPCALRDRLERAPPPLVIDTRSPEAFAGGHIPGSASVWLDGLPIFGGWLTSPETPVLLVVDDAHAVNDAILHLARIGVDRVEAVLGGGFDGWRDAGLPVQHTGAITAQELHDQRDRWTLLDVREVGEYEAGHVAGAHHVYVGHLPDRIDEIHERFGRDRPIAVTCSVGHRGGMGTSILARRGFEIGRAHV